MHNLIKQGYILILSLSLNNLFFSYLLACNPPKGIFLLLPAGTYPTKEILKEDFISGISVRVKWEDIEKSPGKYDWEYLNKIFNIAKKEHKKVFLRLLGGFWAPSWIYDKGVPCLTIKIQGKGFAAKMFIKKYGENIKLPIVWNEKYLKLWSSFVRAVGKKYSSKSGLVLVHLSGPTFFSAEVILARNYQELEKLKAYGFNEEVILKAWEKTIEIFKTAFPQKPLALNIHYIVKKPSLEIYLKLVKLSYRLLKERLVIQGNWLTPRHVLWLSKNPDMPDKKMLKLFWQACKRGIPTGFQEAYPFSKAIGERNISVNKLKKVRKLLLMLFYKLKINYIEIYPEDAKNIFWKNLWKAFLKKA